MTELDRIGRAGRQVGEFHWIHAIAVDSDGNMYTGEVDTGSADPEVPALWRERLAAAKARPRSVCTAPTGRTSSH